MSQVAERHGTYAAAFEAFRREPSFGGDALRVAREAAFETFLDRGFPSTHDEEWQFTSVQPIARETFVRANTMAPSAADVAPFLFDGIGTQVVIINGRVSKTLSHLSNVPSGVTIHTLSDAAPTVESLGLVAGKHAEAAPQGVFADLNDAFFEDVVSIRVAANAVVTEPIHILALAVSRDASVLVTPRVVIHVGEAAQASIVETYACFGDGTTLTSAVTRVSLAARAVVNHVKLQRETDTAFHLATMSVSLSRSSTFTSQALTFGGRIARNDISAWLGGEGAECTLNGLYIATGDSLVDTHTTVDHAMPHCPSHEVYKGILGGRAKAVFNGKILVRQDAQKTDAKQTNRVLLLTDEATVNTKPQLEIFADDVKCTHGAAIGQLDEDAMFYLRARGVDETSARIMLIHAFAGQVLDGITSPVVQGVARHLVDQKLSIE